jgi:murein DD-endopeptidase MepM/ murein hydrolase activator NlpD
MITASLKQNISRRAKPKPGTRFTLLVGGRVKGVWENKSAVPPRLVPGAPAAKKGAPAGWRQWLAGKRRLFLIGILATVVLAAIALAGGALARPAFGPLELPAASPLLQSGSSDADNETDAAADTAGPLVLKNLSVSTYRVKAGESLPAIAKKLGVDVDTLISFNGISNAQAVTRGTALTVPNRPGLRYRVRPGDSLLKISKQFKVGLDDLLDWNNLARSVITPGQMLFIPGGRLSAAAVSKVLGTLFAWPTAGSISSFYGMRISPITGTRLFHNGLDITNYLMTPIKASSAGRVAMVDYNPTYGNFIILVHDNGFQTLYGHMKETYVKKGMNVAQGQRIGAMGSTGASTGSHLHFSIFKNGQDVDPLKYLH